MSSFVALFLTAGVSLTQLGIPDPLIEPATGIHFAAAPTVDTQAYQCLGVGVRQKFVFDVYAITFCVDAAATEPLVTGAQRFGAHADGLAKSQAFFDALTQDAGAKMVSLHMVRDVAASSLAGAFRDSLKSVLSEEKIAKVVAAIPGDVAKGTTVRIYTDAEHDALHILIGDHESTIEDADVARHIWHVWLGQDSVVPTLKKSIAQTFADDLARRK